MQIANNLSADRQHAQIYAAYQSARQQLIDQITPDNHWTGCLSSSALSTATAVSALSFYQQAVRQRSACQLAALDVSNEIDRQINRGIAYLAGQQNNDGGWGDTDLSHSNIATTMLVVAAFHAAQRESEFSVQVGNGERYVESEGGVAGLRQRYGRDKTFAVPILANCAMARVADWSQVSALPFEAACVPQQLFSWMRMPVVSYAVPALVAIGQAKFFNDPPRNPVTRLVRRASVSRSLRVLRKMQPASGGYLEAIPLTSFVTMALIKSGKPESDVVTGGVRFLLSSFRDEGDGSGSWPIDTNLATWNTTLSINALANEAEVFGESELDWNQILDWLLSCQHTEVHPLSGAAPGGWGWSDLSGAVPDADDTPGALLALKNLQTRAQFDRSTIDRILSAAKNGIRWLVDLQNRDLGWPTFCRGWGRLPFDRSGTDITAHAIRALAAWRPEFDSPRTQKAIQKGFKYLRSKQEPDGSWIPLWFGNQDMADETNPVYGTAKVLLAYRDTGSLDTNEAKIGLRWLIDHQNQDGGWGGGPSVNWQDARLGSSTVEETALAVEVLTDHPSRDARAAAERGLRWLAVATETGKLHASWPIGFYFAKLWYHEQLYPLIFATSALGRAVRQRDRFDARDNNR